ncbi:unnamed protein product [Arctia plantaginis]|uniref:Uncharacterized protein n=1 Tax=Arctia plantaginis TaxID=874455 RepID=A0A8S1A7B5_ARCPL|nr:unnamed protein product [Arctia plantaginis]
MHRRSGARHASVRVAPSVDHYTVLHTRVHVYKTSHIVASLTSSGTFLIEFEYCVKESADIKEAVGKYQAWHRRASAVVMSLKTSA